MDILELLAFSVKNKASDLHLSAGSPPMMRVEGDLRTIHSSFLEQEEVSKMIHAMMNERKKKEFADNLETDFSFEISNLGRFRVNAFRQFRGAAAVFRIIPPTLYSMEELHLPTTFKQLAHYSKGLILVTGPTGSGKSTSLAALIDYINTSRDAHILTIEDPIEFVHQNKKALVNQREVHKDSLSFPAALRSALRADPDIILIGELRDTETMRLAMTAAETGHLVLASLHTNSATKTINRIMDLFPAEEKAVVRSLLSESLQAVVAQNLVKKREGGRIVALEIMLCTNAIRHLIREDKVAQMYSCIQTGQAIGMQTLDQHLIKLFNQGLISSQVAFDAAMNKGLFQNEVG